jgi:diacylglycerol kinase family enzyme
MVPAPVLVNPASGRGGFLRDRQPTARLQQVLGALTATGFGCQLEITESAEHVRCLASDWAQRGAFCVFALGGDGMQRTTASGLLGSSTALAPLPGGTANVLAPALGLPRSALAAARSYNSQHSRVRFIDVGHCGEEIFLMMASRGLDARALEHVNRPLKRWLGKLGVALSGALEWLRAVDPRFDYRIDDAVLSASFLAICNIAGYGGLAELAPAARVDDRKLDLVALDAVGRMAILRFALAALRGRHQPTTGVTRQQAGVTRQQIEAVTLPGEGEVLMQLDGDPLRFQLPVRIGLDDRRLAVLAP